MCQKTLQSLQHSDIAPLFIGFAATMVFTDGFIYLWWWVYSSIYKRTFWSLKLNDLDTAVFNLNIDEDRLQRLGESIYRKSLWMRECGCFNNMLLKMQDYSCKSKSQIASASVMLMHLSRFNFTRHKQPNNVWNRHQTQTHNAAIWTTRLSVMATAIKIVTWLVG